MFESSKSFHKLVGFSALSIAGSAAFFSVFGLSKLFAGAQFAVVIMAGSLEFGKLVAASFLYRYWDKINLPHKTYMTIATVILILITSAGIFGFLSNAYQGATVEFEKESTLLMFKEDRLEQLEEDKTFLKQELEDGIADLPDNYRTARRKLREEYQPLIQDVNKNILNLKGDIGDLKAKLVETGVDVGPAIYIARTFDTDVDTVVKFFIFILIFVFDPMAVMFVISYNVTLLDRKKSPKVNDTPNITTGKKWWEVYGEEKKKEIQRNMHQTIKEDKRFDKGAEPIVNEEEIESDLESNLVEDVGEDIMGSLPEPIRGQFSRMKKS